MTMAAGNHDQENQTNTLREHHMETAIETVLSNQEQSYDDFMGCFVSLQKEDVVAHQAQMMEKMLKQREEKTTKVQSSETDASKEDDQSTQINIEEEIEIEELDDGYFAPARNSMGGVTGHKFVQVDNFVEDAELSEDDLQGGDSDNEELEASHYESSFCLHEDFPKTPLKLSKDIVRKVEGEDVEGESSVVHLDVQGSHEMRTLPGEAEDERDGRASSLTDDAVHQTRLKMSTKINQDADNSEQAEVKPEISTDDVQPFSMDKDFDYDNVVLTPKWDSNHTPPGWKPGC